MKHTQDGLPIVEVRNGPVACILKAYVSATEAMENGEASVVQINHLKYLREDD